MYYMVMEDVAKCAIAARDAAVPPRATPPCRRAAAHAHATRSRCLHCPPTCGAFADGLLAPSGRASGGGRDDKFFEKERNFMSFEYSAHVLIDYDNLELRTDSHPETKDGLTCFLSR